MRRSATLHGQFVKDSNAMSSRIVPVQEYPEANGREGVQSPLTRIRRSPCDSRNMGGAVAGCLREGEDFGQLKEFCLATFRAGPAIPILRNRRDIKRILCERQLVLAVDKSVRTGVAFISSNPSSRPLKVIID